VSLLHLKGAQAVLPQERAVIRTHIKFSIMNLCERAFADAVQAIRQPGVQVVRALLPLEGEVILFIEGDPPAFAAAQTAARCQTVKLIVVGGTQVGFNIDRISHCYTSLH